jgi:hypothetical protein
MIHMGYELCIGYGNGYHRMAIHDTHGISHATRVVMDTTYVSLGSIMYSMYVVCMCHGYYTYVLCIYNI